MSSLITIKTFIYPHEMDVVRVYLESHGIDCFVKDELTVQAYHVFSPAVGGVKLQVRQGDYLRAETLLVARGYLLKEEKEQSTYEPKWEKFASNIPVLNKWRPENRIVFSVFLLVILIMTAIYFVFYSSKNMTSLEHIEKPSQIINTIYRT